MEDQLRTRINLSAITHNARVLKDLVGEGVRLMAAVKADGYNHGAVEVARAAGAIDAFGVATADEALELRNAGITKPVMAWLWSPGETALAAVAAGVELAVPTMRHLRWLIDAGVNAEVSLKLETGMHRAGIEEESWHDAFTLLRNSPQLVLKGVFSHLACADEPANPVTDQQADALRRAIEMGRSYGFELPVNHLANSAATLTRPDLLFDQVRVGLALYGISPVRGSYGLRPAMTWAADVMAVKPIAPGDGVSYGHTFHADRHGFVGLVAVGYADGLPRSAQGVVDVAIAGRRYRQIGRICMDQIVIDLGDNPHAVAPGDEAVIFGDDPGAMSAEELARAIDTIAYEVVCLPKARTSRTYVTEEAQ